LISFLFLLLASQSRRLWYRSRISTAPPLRNCCLNSVNISGNRFDLTLCARRKSRATKVCVCGPVQRPAAPPLDGSGSDRPITLSTTRMK
jgi:hypothetical protein